VGLGEQQAEDVEPDYRMTTEFSGVKDSGKREEFPTGSVRDTREGKGRFDLLSPIFLQRLARHVENGAKKYGDRNWEKGQGVMRYFDSCSRHLNKWLEGHRDEDHLAAAAWNIQGMIHTIEMVQRGHLPEALLVGIPDYMGESRPPSPSPVKAPAESSS